MWGFTHAVCIYSLGDAWKREALGTPRRTRSLGVGGCFPNEFPLYIYAKVPTLPMWVSDLHNSLLFLSLSLYLSLRSSVFASIRSRDPSFSSFSLEPLTTKWQRTSGFSPLTSISLQHAFSRSLHQLPFSLCFFFWVCFFQLTFSKTSTEAVCYLTEISFSVLYWCCSLNWRLWKDKIVSRCSS